MKSEKILQIVFASRDFQTLLYSDYNIKTIDGTSLSMSRLGDVVQRADYDRFDRYSIPRLLPDRTSFSRRPQIIANRRRLQLYADFRNLFANRKAERSFSNATSSGFSLERPLSDDTLHPRDADTVRISGFEQDWSLAFSRGLIVLLRASSICNLTLHVFIVQKRLRASPGRICWYQRVSIVFAARHRWLRRGGSNEVYYLGRR